MFNKTSVKLGVPLLLLLLVAAASITGSTFTSMSAPTTPM
jgi:uncharacterized protein (UPF0333 family)